MKIKTDLDFTNISRIKGLPNAIAADEAVNLAQLDAITAGMSWKDACRVASIADISLFTPVATIDGVAMVLNDRVLLKDQTSSEENGIYIWNGMVDLMTRAEDAASWNDLELAITPVEEGTSAGSVFRQTQVNGILDTDPIMWTVFGAAVPSATEAIPGISERATSAETIAGSDDQRHVTPLKLKNWWTDKGNGYITINHPPVNSDVVPSEVSNALLANQCVIRHVPPIAAVSAVNMYVMFQIPGDFSSFPSNSMALDVYQKNGPPTFSITATNVRTGTIDPTINAANILSTAANNTMQTKVLSLTGTYLPGDFVLMAINSTGSAGVINGFGKMSIEYVRK